MISHMLHVNATNNNNNTRICIVSCDRGDSPAQPINNVCRYQYGELYGLACKRPTILLFLNWSKTGTPTYLQTFGTILFTFSTNSYLIKLLTLIISGHVRILSLTIGTNSRNYISRMHFKDIDFIVLYDCILSICGVKLWWWWWWAWDLRAADQELSCHHDCSWLISQTPSY